MTDAAQRPVNVLDPAQLVRIEAVHRDFFFQHLYAVQCLLSAACSSALSVGVESDEDIEVQLKRERIYVQVKHRKASLAWDDIEEALSHIFTLPGLSMMIVGGAVGALMALALFAITAFSMPMLLHRPVDFVTAIITSIAAVWANLQVMISWAAIIAALLFLAMIPAFLGLLIVLPVLGHATWHLYHRAIAEA